MSYVINAPCIGTRDASCVEACPVDAITAEHLMPPERQAYMEINAAYHR